MFVYTRFTAKVMNETIVPGAYEIINRALFIFSIVTMYRQILIPMYALSCRPSPKRRSARLPGEVEERLHEWRLF